MTGWQQLKTKKPATAGFFTDTVIFKQGATTEDNHAKEAS